MEIQCREYWQDCSKAPLTTSLSLNTLAKSCDDVIVSPKTQIELRPQKGCIAIFEPRSLVRDCLVRCLTDLRLATKINAYATIREWMNEADTPEGPTVLLLSAAGRSISELKDDWSEAVSEMGPAIAVAVLTEDMEPHHVREALRYGVRGYIPSSMPLWEVVDALQLIQDGGIFVPSSCFMPSPGVASPLKAREPVQDPVSGLFTERQLSVLQALRKGKSNKIIAHELSLAESTVKIHVRNIMRMLKASNRTQVTYIFNTMNGQTI